MAGAEVVVVDKDDHTLARSFSAEPCRLLPGDVGHDGITELAEELVADGPIELVVNNVGVTNRQGVLDVGPGELDQVLVTNLQGPWLFTDRLVKALIAERQRAPQRQPRPSGSILFISSLHDRFVAENADYGVSKAGVAMLAKTMAKQLAPHRIRVNAISPDGSGRPRTPPPPSRWPSTPACDPGSRWDRRACPPTSPGWRCSCSATPGRATSPARTSPWTAACRCTTGWTSSPGWARPRGSAAGAGQQAAGAALADLVALLLEQGDGAVQLVGGLAAPAAEQQHLGQVEVGLGPRIELVGPAGQVDGLPGQPLGLPELAPAGHGDGPDGAPFDLGVGLLGGGQPLADAGQLLGLVDAAPQQ